MKRINRRVLVILVMLKLLMPVALVAAANNFNVAQTTRTFSQTAVHTLLTQFADPDCTPADEPLQSADFDMTQPMPDCWLLNGPREIQIE